MSHPQSGWPEPEDDDARSTRHRARHGDAAPERYPQGGSWREARFDPSRTANPRADGGPRHGRHGADFDDAEPWAGGYPRADPYPGAAAPYPGAADPYPGGAGYFDAPPVPPYGEPRPGGHSGADPRSGGRPGAEPRPGRRSAAAPPGPPPGPALPGPPPPVPAVPPVPEDDLDLTQVGERTGRGRAQRAAEAAPKKSRAGRNLPAAIVVGVLLAAAVLGPLVFYKPAFIAVLVLAAVAGTWEMARAVRTAGIRPPMVPLLVSGAVMLTLAWYGNAEALTLGLLVCILATMIWRLADGPEGFGRDIGAVALILTYVPFLLGFGALLAAPEDGAKRIFVVLVCVVFSDTGGYAAGVFFGRHRMAPQVSPGKSWEGFVGSLVATGAAAAVLLYAMFDVPWWQGALVGVATSAAAVVGDLAESLLKRDLGVKDMSNMLPGHGGIMDRLDSVLFAVPTVYLFLQLLAPPGS
jgi:phosphatidate cytidylyltransferase